MKGHLIIGYLVVSVVLTGCKGCISRFYGVHEDIQYDDIIFHTPGVKASVLLDYVDHEPATDAAYYEVRDAYDGLKMGRKDRIVHFKKDPEEYYWLSVDKALCNIIAIHNRKIDSDWIFTMNRLNPAEAQRIGTRFSQAILSKLDSSANFKVGPGDR